MEDEFRITAQELSGAVEAILFVSGDSVSADKIAETLECRKSDVAEVLKTLMDKYDQNPWGGLCIRRTEDSYCMMTKPSEKKVLERLLGPKVQAPLSQASYETLAIIAYNQPCTRSQVETVRGVSSDSIISRLLDRGWIEEAGNLDAPGRPALFRTSRQFLLEFGIESVSELPSMELMSYKTIRDLEDSLRKAAGGEDRQITIDSLMQTKSDDEAGNPIEQDGADNGDN
ncbi:MAG: SMC-Scp complex subunit ScpB [Saccharofermentans sp.]|jgi:segregation and condensation protein B|nr:SMC-Scp complex subunit ScpB [Mageeibacillus sp.]MCI1263409.1 SMC-Scp complex subunit ScpB [Saccharofermentans sp.]MCI1274862.1 SMC-Scp complex subunit ScpB [Saccharofermentans sp.]MCI1769078.1 SMC-Scp complex subunit ScpB [Mageeibacillus sp.]MCI2044108.1 SMC-Scp complex subunit ScpB [Mageeibacillus sp.]